MLVSRACLVFRSVPLLRWYLAHAGFFWRSIVMLVSRARLVFFWCSIVKLVSRARLVFFVVPLLCWYLAHAWVFLVFHRYVSISRTLGFFLVFHRYVGIWRTLISRMLGLFWCSIVTLLSSLVFLGVPLLCWYLVHAWFFWSSIVMLVSRARLVFFGVPLLCWSLARAWFFLVFIVMLYLAHTWFFLVFHCYVGISSTLGSFWCSIVTLVSRLVFLGAPLLSWNLAHPWFFSLFHCYVGNSRTLRFS